MQKTPIILMVKCLATVSNIWSLSPILESNSLISCHRPRIIWNPSKWYGRYFWVFPWRQYGFSCSFSSKILRSRHVKIGIFYARIFSCSLSNSKHKNPYCRLFLTLKSMGKKRDIDSLKPKVSIKQSNMDGIFSRYTLKKANTEFRYFWSRKINWSTVEHASNHQLLQMSFKHLHHTIRFCMWNKLFKLEPLSANPGIKIQFLSICLHFFLARLFILFTIKMMNLYWLKSFQWKPSFLPSLNSKVICNEFFQNTMHVLKSRWLIYLFNIDRKKYLHQSMQMILFIIKIKVNKSIKVTTTTGIIYFFLVFDSIVKWIVSRKHWPWTYFDLESDLFISSGSTSGFRFKYCLK